MKRLLIAIFALLITSGASAQMQTKFFGLELGKEYNSNLDLLRADLKKYSSWIETKRDQLTLHDVKFGGYDWNFARYDFAGHDKKKLVAAGFAKSSEDQQELGLKMASLMIKLYEKYGEPSPESKVEEKDSLLTWDLDDGRHRCMLSFSEYKGLWIMTLMYISMEAGRQAKQSEINEL